MAREPSNGMQNRPDFCVKFANIMQYYRQYYGHLELCVSCSLCCRLIDNSYS